MTVFAKRGLQLAMGGPHDVMMFSAESGELYKQDIFIGLPKENMLKAFPGFESVTQESLPDYLTTLVVREDGFRERFPDIARKRRTRFE